MPERYVVCGGIAPDRSETDILRINVNAPMGSPERINLKIEDIRRPLVDNIPEVLTDLLEIAAYVFCADQFTSRGSTLMSHMGAQWRRRFRFRIPVRRSSIWRAAETQEALKETLEFLSEDEFEFEFVQASHSAPLQTYLEFTDPASQVLLPDEVILFSGGLDSLGGATDALGACKRVVLVSHKASNMIASKQLALVQELRSRSLPGTVFHVPVAVNSGRKEAKEFTQRTRSFLFATLGLIVARMFGRTDLSFYENGIVSVNLPVADHVLGVRASRTTHPRVLANCSQLFSLLLAEQFSIHNPYLWKTKSDVIRVLADHHAADLIKGTLSCARIRETTKSGKHCGVCSQCIDRRFGVLAAGLGDHEHADQYAIDLFDGEHQPGPALSMIESYILRAEKLSAISEQTFLATYGQVFRVIPWLSGSPNANAQKLWDLYRRHGQEVVSVVDVELKRTASLTETLTRRRNSLRSLILSESADQAPYTDPIAAEKSVVAQAAEDEHDYAPNQIHIAIDKANRTVLFNGGIELGGTVYDLVSQLAQHFEADLEAGTVKDEYRFIKASTWANRLGIEEPSLRRRVSRARKKIEQSFADKFRRDLDLDDVIQNQEWRGYRLNPYLLFIRPGQLRDNSAPASQLRRQGVTASLAGR